MPSIKDRAFEIFDEEGPLSRTANELAEELDTDSDYVYDLRRQWREARDEPEERGAGAEGRGVVELDEPEDTDPQTDDPDTDPTEGDQPGSDAVEVSHEGSEKLSPAGFEDESVSSVDPPENVDLPADLSPDDLEPGPEPSPDPDPEPERTQADRDDSGPDPEPSPEQDSDDGVLSRLLGSDDGEETEARSSEEIVDDAPTEAERGRREDVLRALDGSAQSGGSDPESSPDPGPSPDGPDPTTMQNGMVVDEELVGTLFGMPFAQAANATGWDGWELSKAEKRANAELIVAYCDEQDIDLSTGSMLAMSLLSTVGGRAAGYAQHRRSTPEPDPSPKAAPSPEPEPESEPEQAGTNGGDEAPTQTQTEASPQTTQSEEPVAESTATPDDSFDFNDPSTWE